MGFTIQPHDVMVTGTSEELPVSIRRVLAASTLDGVHPDETTSVAAGGLSWAAPSWGRSTDPPLLLVHGIMSDAGVFWRLGPALAQARWSVTALDLPGHGGTWPWKGRYALADTAADVAACIRAVCLGTDRLVVLGHSWGGMVSVHLPAQGLRPRALILLDPPYLARDELVALTRDPVERFYDSSENAGVTMLANPSATGLPVWHVRGDPRFGGLIPDAVLPQLADRVGRDRVLTIAGGSDGPMRTRRPGSLTIALLRALDGSRGPSHPAAAG